MDERIDQQQTEQLAELTGRLARLESALAESPVTAAAVRDLFPGVEPLAVPPDVADGQVITAAHINAIKASITTWQTHVDANGMQLNNFLSISGKSVPLAAVNDYSQPLILQTSIGSSTDMMSLFCYRDVAVNGDWRDAAWHLRRFVNGSTAVSDIVMSTYRLSFSVAAVEGLRIDGSSGIKISIPQLRSTNPGAGSKELWYDPADGNRVKFAV